MGECEPRGMQKRAIESLHGADVAWHAPMHTTVERVAHNRMADRAEVHANLMGAPRVNGDLAEGQPRKMFRARDPRHGVPGMLGASRHLLPMRRIAADRRIDAASRLDDAPDERNVFLLDLAILELPCQFLMSGVVLRDDHHT